MKKNKLFGIIAIIAVIVIGFVGCPNNEPPDPCAAGHTYGGYTQTTLPTCTEPGIKTRICTVADCGVTDPVTEEGEAALGHLAPGGTPPTCTTDGDTGTGVCTRVGCNVHVDSQTIPATGHQWENIDGVLTCTICDEKLDGSTMEKAIPLTKNIWADGELSDIDSEIWFKFTATTSATNGQRIHFVSVDSSVMIYAQLYNESGSMVDSKSSLHNSTTNISRTVTIENIYYIQVTPYSATYINRPFKIGFNDSATPPPSVTIPTTGIIELTNNVWEEGELATADSEQWFKFTATTSATNGQRIHFNPGTSSSVYMQLYNEDGSAVSTRSGLSTNLSRTVTENNTYYIQITYWLSSSIGNFRIAFNDSATPPPSVTIPTTGVIQLTNNEWKEGIIATADEELWYSFTATATSQLIHFTPGSSSVFIYVQLYDSTGSTVGSRSSFFSTGNISRTVTIENVYYIQVTPYSATYIDRPFKIAFNDSVTPPPSITIPTTGVIELTYNEWKEGNIATADSEQWFKFTATTSTTNGQRIHFNPGTSSTVYIQLYDENGSMMGSRSSLSTNVSRTVTENNTYYIKITYWLSSSIGNFGIAFNDSTTPPPSIIPTTGVIELTNNEWAEGIIATADSELWYSFTATATSQRIHFTSGPSSVMIYAQLYNENGITVDSRSALYNSSPNISRTVTIENVYYIKVTPFTSLVIGNFKIAFNDSVIPPSVTIPTTGVIELTQNVWEDGNLPNADSEQWFKFTATTSAINGQRIHFNPGTSNVIYAQLYNEYGSAIGSLMAFVDSGNNSMTVINESTYYIKLTPFVNGNFKIAFNDSTAPPLP